MIGCAQAHKIPIVLPADVSYKDTVEVKHRTSAGKIKNYLSLSWECG